MALIDLSSLSTTELFPGFSGRFIHTPNMTIGYWDIRKGSKLPEHSHVHEQITHVLEGELELTIDGVTGIVKAGTVAVIPANAKHSGTALSDCKALDVFYPVREDYKKF